jgi:hypothetical protein
MRYNEVGDIARGAIFARKATIEEKIERKEKDYGNLPYLPGREKKSVYRQL